MIGPLAACQKAWLSSEVQRELSTIHVKDAKDGTRL